MDSCTFNNFIQELLTNEEINMALLKWRYFENSAASFLIFDGDNLVFKGRINKLKDKKILYRKIKCGNFDVNTQNGVEFKCVRFYLA